MKVTSADVAKAAGVSRATVSYVLNGVDARVSTQTRERVLTCARELGYVPHAHASALRGGRTSVVVIAMPAWPLGPPVAEAISALVTELDGLGYTPLVHFRHWSGPDGLTKACDRVRPVGLLAPFADLPPERVEALRANGTRAILALAQEPQPHVAAIAFDQALVGEVAIEHLIERGHTRVVGILPREPELLELARRRFSRVSGVQFRALAADAFELGDATAVFAFSDQYALEVLDGLPAGTAVIGVDNSPAAHASRPRLSTVGLVPEPIWRAAARRMHELIEQGDAADTTPIIARPTLIVGETT